LSLAAGGKEQQPPLFQKGGRSKLCLPLFGPRKGSSSFSFFPSPSATIRKREGREIKRGACLATISTSSCRGREKKKFRATAFYLNREEEKRKEEEEKNRRLFASVGELHMKSLVFTTLGGKEGREKESPGSSLFPPGG